MFYITLKVGRECIEWDLRSGSPDSTSVRIESGEAFSYPAATYQAGNAIQRYFRLLATPKGTQ